MRISNTGTTKVSKCEKKEGKRDTSLASILYYLWVEKWNKGDFVGLCRTYTVLMSDIMMVTINDIRTWVDVTGSVTGRRRKKYK
jgi:hypothetical protein